MIQNIEILKQELCNLRIINRLNLYYVCKSCYESLLLYSEWPTLTYANAYLIIK